MIDKGADVIFGAGGKTGNGALAGLCRRRASTAIGVDTDQYLTVPEAQKVLLSSAMKLITPGVFDLLKAAKDGKLRAGGNARARSAWRPIHDLDSKVPAEVKSKTAGNGKGPAGRLDQDGRASGQAELGSHRGFSAQSRPGHGTSHPLARRDSRLPAG